MKPFSNGSSRWARTYKVNLPRSSPTLNSVKSDASLLNIGAIKSDIGSLASDIGSLKSDIGSITSDVSSLKTEIFSLRNEFQLFRGEMEIRIDRIEGMTNQTRAEMLNLRADFREWKDQLNESLA